MTKFQFQTDTESEDFCNSILIEMVRKFAISEKEALGRINAAWKGAEIYDGDVIFHEDEVYWANAIYYGNDSMWWQNPDGLKPLPYSDEGESA